MPIKCLAALALVLAAGSAFAKDRPAPRLTDKEAKALAKALDGKVPGKPVSCVSRILGTDGLHAVSDGVLIYKVNRNLVYRNDLSGTCSGISRGNTLVLKPTNDQYCSGDIVRSVDLTIGMQAGSCGLGEFVPYRTPGSK